LLWVSLVQFIAFLTGAYGFIPAFPTNNSAALVSDVYNATNATDASVLSAQWFAPGSVFSPLVKLPDLAYEYLAGHSIPVYLTLWLEATVQA
jgi:hypothetical protein